MLAYLTTCSTNTPNNKYRNKDRTKYIRKEIKEHRHKSRKKEIKKQIRKQATRTTNERKQEDSLYQGNARKRKEKLNAERNSQQAIIQTQGETTRSKYR